MLYQANSAFLDESVGSKHINRWSVGLLRCTSSRKMMKHSVAEAWDGISIRPSKNVGFPDFLEWWEIPTYYKRQYHRWKRKTSTNTSLVGYIALWWFKMPMVINLLAGLVFETAPFLGKNTHYEGAKRKHGELLIHFKIFIWGVSIKCWISNHAGWFIMENPMKNEWFRATSMTSETFINSNLRLVGQSSADTP